jgi:hypothetical protein
MERWRGVSLYELVVERHHQAATVATSNREPIEWLVLMADPLLAQSAIGSSPVGGLRSGARRRQLSAPPPANARGAHRAGTFLPAASAHLTPSSGLRHPRFVDGGGGPEVVPCHWRKSGPITLAGDKMRRSGAR